MMVNDLLLYNILPVKLTLSVVSVFWSENGLEMSAAITFVARNWVVFADGLKFFFLKEGFYIIKLHRTKL